MSICPQSTRADSPASVRQRHHLSGGPLTHTDRLHTRATSHWSATIFIAAATSSVRFDLWISELAIPLLNISSVNIINYGATATRPFRRSARAVGVLCPVR